MLTPTSHKKVYVICPVCEKSKLTEVRSIGQYKSCKCQSCTHKYGLEHWNYNSTLTDEEREQKRDLQKNDEWRNAVYKRDNYTCQICKQKGKKLNAHHLNGYNWDISERFSVDNGITLCVNCHKSFHKAYGYKNNTIEQYKEFEKSAI